MKDPLIKRTYRVRKSQDIFIKRLTKRGLYKGKSESSIVREFIRLSQEEEVTINKLDIK